MILEQLAAPGQLQRFGQSAQLTHHPRQMRTVADIQEEVNGGGAAIALRGINGFDIGVGGGNSGGSGEEEENPLG